VFHANAFERFHEWREDKKVKVRQRLITLLHKRARGHAVAVVLVKPYENAKAEGLTPGSLAPFGFAVLEALKKVRDWAAAQSVQHPISYFFENRPEHRGGVEGAMRFTESKPNLREQFCYSTWGWVPNTAAPVQAAAMLAYELWKECANGLLVAEARGIHYGNPWRH
jgi:hypothetical protein